MLKDVIQKVKITKYIKFFDLEISMVNFLFVKDLY
jgi:hypothetical protein